MWIKKPRAHRAPLETPVEMRALRRSQVSLHDTFERTCESKQSNLKLNGSFTSNLYLTAPDLLSKRQFSLQSSVKPVLVTGSLPVACSWKDKSGNHGSSIDSGILDGEKMARRESTTFQQRDLV